MKVCIVGGGISGLCCAYYLSKKGIDVSLFERQGVLGGNCTSYHIEGYTIDTGLHYPFYFSEDDALFEVLKDNKNLFVNSLPPVLDRNYMEYRIFNSRFTPTQILRLFYYLLLKRFGKFSFDGSLNDILKKTKLYEPSIIKWAYPWSYSCWGLDLRNVSAEMVLNSLFVKKMSPFEFMKACANRIFSGRFTPDQFLEGYPKGGIRTITDILAESTKKAGAKIYLNREITKIKKTNTDFILNIGENIYNFDKIVYTAPIQNLPRIIDLPTEFENKTKKAIAWKAITIWLGIDKMYFKEARPHFTDAFFPVLLPVSLFDKSLAPKNHQLIGIASGLSKRNVDKEYIINRILDTVERNYPNLLDYEVFRQIQFLNITSTKQGILDEKFQYNTPIDGLFLAGTNVFEDMVGINWAANTGMKVAQLISQSRQES